MRSVDEQKLTRRLAHLWLASCSEFSSQRALSTICRRVSGYYDRKTHAMKHRNLRRAREQRLADAPCSAERPERTKCYVLANRNHAGVKADCQSCRHFFITNLQRAGMSPKLAQSLARHSDIRLTLQVYTHVELSDQVAAI